ncbi:helix-turn-helix domain-containing protein [Gilvimarinus algae]|uniref:AraC family transcriptional regulator n=1 Tax=Gilvimarinus algae TaxID=3058037 RepID=A0ABT8THR6_9GAMM|nr:AraC family transcriptional regulator [Gilvimarinus sp. SDUM040014]MDO3383632.1 AraC family transcriptional regulator [Gilvimarinus sp. SDUM040014]
MQFLETLNRPLFNLYDFTLWMTALQCLIFAVLLQCRREKSASHHLLSLFVASIGLGQLAFFLTYNPYLSGILSHLGQWSFAPPALVFYLQGPLLFHYLRALTFGRHRFRFMDLLPLGLWAVASSLSLVLWNETLELWLWRPFVLVGAVGFIVSTAYGLASMAVIRRYSERLKDQFCTVESLDFLWLKFFAWGFLFIWCMQVLPPFTYHTAPWVVQEVITHLPSIVELIMVSFVIVAGLLYARRMEKVTEEPEWGEPRSDALPPTGEMLRELDQRMRAEALYAKPRLNIERLAGQLDMPPRQLSHLINHYFHKNFFEFINDYRLEQVQIRLRSPGWQDKSVQEIYESVGFRSKSSFFTLFRKATGMTPTQYRAADQ